MSTAPIPRDVQIELMRDVEARFASDVRQWASSAQVQSVLRVDSDGARQSFERTDAEIKLAC